LDDVGGLGGFASAAALAAATAGDLVLDAGGRALQTAEHRGVALRRGLTALRDCLADGTAIRDALELVGETAELVGDRAHGLVAGGLQYLLPDVLELV